MSSACCASLFAWPGKSESGVMGGRLPGAERSAAPCFPISSDTLRSGLRNGPASSLELARAKRNYYKIRTEASAVPTFFGPVAEWPLSRAKSWLPPFSCSSSLVQGHQRLPTNLDLELYYA